MWPYWMMFTLPAFAAVFSAPNHGAKPSLRKWTVAWVGVACAIALLVGFRFEVGGDWFSYFDYLDNVQGLSVFEVLTLSDPGYQFANWMSTNLGWGIYGTNLLCGALFALGLVRFCLAMPRPWLALTVAVPYLLIVVAMGYSRQGVALGLAMLGFVALQEKALGRFVFCVVLGATFHKSAVLLLPLAIVARSRNRYLTIVSIVLVTGLAYFVLLRNSAEELYLNYVETQYQSEGAAIRLAMNVLPAVLLLYSWNRFELKSAVNSLWRWFAVISIAMVVVLYGTGASTAVDRVALYILPLQIVVFSHLPDALARQSHRHNSQMWAFVIVAYYFVVQFVWLNFGIHAHLWVPYRFYPLDGGL